jgi:Zn-dependent peptidase ImmA (M78 family)
MIDKVKIDTVIYDVVVTDKTIVVKGRECKGSVDYDKNLIEIADFLGKEQSKVTLMHEIVHGMAYERGIQFGDTGEETIVEELGKAIIQVVRDNKELVEYIGN